MQIKTCGILVTLLFWCVSPALFYTQSVEATPGTIIVPDQYPTIQEGVNNANPGDTIFVRAGTYFEQVVVDKAVTLLGESPWTTIVDAAGEESVFFLTASNVKVSGFNIRNLLEGQYPYGEGVYLHHSNNSVIEGNSIVDVVEGIHASYSDSGTIKGNVIRNVFSEGIVLIDESNNFTISNNLISKNYWGIRIQRSQNHTIRSNLINSNQIGIEVYGSPNITIEDNILKFNKAYLKGVGTGIVLSNSEGCTLRNNTLSDNDYNFGVEGTETKHFIQLIDSSNTVNGKPMYYLVNEKNRKVPEDAGYVAVVNSRNILVTNVTVDYNFQGVLFVNSTDSIIQNSRMEINRNGIFLLDSTNNLLENSTITHLEEYYKFGPGIHLERSNNNTISLNRLSNNLMGIRLYDSHNNTINGNSVKNTIERALILRHSDSNLVFLNSFVNGWQGVYTYWASKNIFYHNNFVSNSIQAYNDVFSLNNIWDNGYPSGGNYWSDYKGIDHDGDGIGDIPYYIDSLYMDRYPLSKPIQDVSIKVTPFKTAVGQGFSLNFEISAMNRGWSQQTFNVTVYANASVVGTQTIALEPSSSAAVTFTWNTAGFEMGNYNISLVADTVSDERNTADNTYSSFTVVALPGDVTGSTKTPMAPPDGRVDYKDVFCFLKAYDSDPTKPNWNPNVDFAGSTATPPAPPDNKVNHTDLFWMRKYFEKTGS